MSEFLLLIGVIISYVLIGYLIKKQELTTFLFFIRGLTNVLFIILLPLLVFKIVGFDLVTIYSSLMLVTIIALLYVIIEFSSQQILSYKLVLIPLVLATGFFCLVFTSRYHLTSAQIMNKKYTRYTAVDISDKNKIKIQKNEQFTYNVAQGWGDSVIISGQTIANHTILVEISKGKYRQEDIVIADQTGRFEKEIKLTEQLEGEVKVRFFIDSIKILPDGEIAVKKKKSDALERIVMNRNYNIVPAGDYIVGKNIEAGEQLLIADKDKDLVIKWQEFGKEVEFIDSIYINLNEGEHISLPNVKMISQKNQDSTHKLDPNYSMLKVGKDIEQGNYEIEMSSGGIVKKYSEPISVRYQGEPIYSKAIELFFGEYVFLSKAKLTKVMN